MRAALLLILAACGGASSAAAREPAAGSADARVGEIEGVIVFAGSREPARGIAVEAKRDHFSRIQITDDDGYYRLHALPAGEYELGLNYADLVVHVQHVVVEPGQVALADWKFDENGTAQQTPTATWQPTLAPPHHDPHMSAGHGAVIGVVTTEKDMTPLRSLTVTAKRGAGGDLTAVTDHRGDFFFDDVVPGDYPLVFQTKDGATGSLGTMHVTAGQVTSVDLSLER